LRNMGELDAVLADYTEAIRLDPRSHKAYANRGQIWCLKGDLHRALADQDLHIRINPNDPIGYSFAEIPIVTGVILRGRSPISTEHRPSRHHRARLSLAAG
jgi:tetratricopeptide (TPR) repeat protein